MGLRKSKPTAELVPIDVPQAITASALQITVENAGWQLNNFGDGAWQADAWRFYDNTPELHNVADYIGAACSMIRLYVCEVDEYGNLQGEVGAPSTTRDGDATDDADPQIAALASNMFGSPGQKSEILRGLGTSLTIAGETYLIGRDKGNGKRGGAAFDWYMVAPNQIRIMGTVASIAIGNGKFEELVLPPDGPNLVFRVWTPHSAMPWRATSPTQGVLVPLRQAQELVRFLSSQLVSRLASASLLPVPSSIDFPATDKHAGGWDGLLQQLYEVITSNLQGAGTAAQIAPILLPMSDEALQAMSNIQPIVFESVLSSQAIDLRKEIRETIAVGLNVPMEITLSGEGRANHWSIWWANEEFIIKTIAPLMNRICDALTQSYLTPALRALGKDPSRYMLWYDTAPLSNSANQLTDAKDLYTLGVISAAELRAKGNFHESAAPTDLESQQRFVREVVLRDPAQFALESVRTFLGIDIPDYMPEPVIDALDQAGPPPPPVPDRVMSDPAPGQKPAIENSESEIIASLTDSPTAVLAAADVTVRRALELAGKRLLTPSLRGMYAELPAHKLHTKFRVGSDGAQLDRILAGAWAHVDEAFEDIADPARMRSLLDRYAKGLITSSMEHSRSLLAAFLAGEEQR
jgi:hypothetical protein